MQGVEENFSKEELQNQIFLLQNQTSLSLQALKHINILMVYIAENI
jgi:hypothetical protein